jgi:hypothetical protein
VPFKIAGWGIPDGSLALDWFNPEVLPNQQTETGKADPAWTEENSLEACSAWEYGVLVVHPQSIFVNIVSTEGGRWLKTSRKGVMEFMWGRW